MKWEGERSKYILEDEEHLHGVESMRTIPHKSASYIYISKLLMEIFDTLWAQSDLNEKRRDRRGKRKKKE